ncbi:TPA: hypothetical protein L6A56_30715 [Pseudomonas aeruginosa]|nr:hypothetical protein [Pseudomonas aeruginosa]
MRQAATGGVTIAAHGSYYIPSLHQVDAFPPEHLLCHLLGGGLSLLLQAADERPHAWVVQSIGIGTNRGDSPLQLVLMTTFRATVVVQGQQHATDRANHIIERESLHVPSNTA